MEKFYGANRLPDKYKNNVVLALGNFDGVHLGHQRVIENAIGMARNLNCLAGALIFHPHPVKVLNPDRAFPLITDLETKTDLLEKLGLDFIVVEPFDRQLAEMSPISFIKSYFEEIIKVKGIVAGYDYTFGHKAGGNKKLLEEWGGRNQVTVSICSPIMVEGEPVSSSIIRKKIKDGETEKAARLLNYYFFRKGPVVPGSGRGRHLGFPTANLEVSPELLLPGEGVYLTLVQVGSSTYFGATNVGRCPTFAANDITVEVNLLDYTGDLYGQWLTLYFIKKIREEKAFSSGEELKLQLKSDIEQVRKMSQHIIDESFLKVN